MNGFYTNVYKRGDKILLRYVDELGVRHRKEVEFIPELYVTSHDHDTKDALSMKGEPLKKKVFNEGIGACEEYLHKYERIDGHRIFGMRNMDFQFIAKEFAGNIKYDVTKIRGAKYDIEVFSGDIDENRNVIPGPFPKPEDAEYPITSICLRNSVDGKFYVWSLEKFKGHYLGTYVHNKDHPKIGHLDVVYRGFDNEFDLLNEFTQWWKSYEFDYHSGWNSEGFDVPYMTNRVRRVLGNTEHNRFSPWGIVKARTYETGFNKQETTYDFLGVAHLDLMQVFKKHAFIQPDDWKLGTVGSKVVGESKLSYEEVGSLNDLYVVNFQKYIEYNIQDTNLLHRIDDKLNLIQLMFTLAYLTKSNYEDGLGTVKPWSSLLYGMLHGRGVEPELKAVYDGDVRFAGGFVRVPRPGKYRWVVSCDLNSLYPHLMQQFNLGPETLIEPTDLPASIRAIPNFTLDDLLHKRVDLSPLKEHDILMTANRQFFKRDKMSILSEKTREIYDTRKDVKKHMLKLTQQKVDAEARLDIDDVVKELIYQLKQQISSENTLQNALKVAMNSLFGAVGNRWFREYFDIRVAEGITMSGQLAIIWISKKLDEYFNKVLGLGDINHRITRTDTETFLETSGEGSVFAFYQDTDSCYLDLSKLVDRMFSIEEQTNNPTKIVNFLDELFSKKIEPFIDESYHELADYLNSYEQRMFMKRESIASAGIWTAKKRYALLVWDNEGVRYTEPDLKYLGLEARKSSTPAHCREWLVECYRIGLEGTQEQLQDRVKGIKKEFKTKPIEEIAAPRGVSDIEKYDSRDATIYAKGCPAHVKAALNHNYLLTKLDIKSVRPISSGDKILFVKLKPSNPYGFDTIGFQGYLPKEFNLDKHVDYEITFEKTFLDALDLYVGAIGWTSTPQASLMEFFT